MDFAQNSAQRPEINGQRNQSHEASAGGHERPSNSGAKVAHTLT